MGDDYLNLNSSSCSIVRLWFCFLKRFSDENSNEIFWTEFRINWSAIMGNKLLEIWTGVIVIARRYSGMIISYSENFYYVRKCYPDFSRFAFIFILKLNHPHKESFHFIDETLSNSIQFTIHTKSPLKTSNESWWKPTRCTVKPP